MGIEENEQSLLDEVDASDKEMMKSMNDLMELSNNDNESDHEDGKEKKVDEVVENGADETKNAEEVAESLDKTTDTFGDLEQFADGLDLENVEVDSDTEQNFELLLEELNDENDDTQLQQKD